MKLHGAFKTQLNRKLYKYNDSPVRYILSFIHNRLMDVTVSHHKARSESTLICFDQYTSSYLICGPHSFAHSQCKLICLRFSSCFFRSNSTRFHYTLFFSVVIFNSSATFFPLQQEAANYSSRKFSTKNYDSNNYFDVS